MPQTNFLRNAVVSFINPGTGDFVMILWNLISEVAFIINRITVFYLNVKREETYEEIFVILFQDSDDFCIIFGARVISNRSCSKVSLEDSFT